MADQPIDTPVSDEQESVAQVRAFILETHQEIVPELVTGSTIADLMASIASAQAAYSRVADAARPVSVPAGGNAPHLLDIESLPTSEKIRRGLAAQRH